MVTGVDLVHWQIRIARGERLTLDRRRTLTPLGHAIEARVYAEDPDAGFLPSPGRLSAHRPPAGPGVRVDAGVESGFEVPVHYDSMVSKLVVWDEDRTAAIERMLRALGEYEVGGVPTTVPLFRWILRLDDFVTGRFDTTYLDRALAERDGAPFVDPPPDGEETAILAAAVHTALRGGGGGPRREAARSWRRAARLEGLR
jgi:acetyl/propionyl-CoA carboxylase alpha subunit